MSDSEVLEYLKRILVRIPQIVPNSDANQIHTGGETDDEWNGTMRRLLQIQSQNRRCEASM